MHASHVGPRLPSSPTSTMPFRGKLYSRGTQGGYLVPNYTEACLCVLPSGALERKLKSSSCDRPIHILSPCLWLPTQEVVKEANVLCPLRGGKPREAGEYISDCTGGAGSRH